MNLYNQEFYNDPDDPNSPPGDCLRACIATLLQRPPVVIPHFALFEASWHQAVEIWAMSHLMFPQFREPVVRASHPSKMIAIGRSPRNTTHCIIVDKVLTTIHDPHESRAGLDEIKQLLFFRLRT